MLKSKRRGQESVELVPTDMPGRGEIICAAGLPNLLQLCYQSGVACTDASHQAIGKAN